MRARVPQIRSFPLAGAATGASTSGPGPGLQASNVTEAAGNLFGLVQFMLAVAADAPLGPTPDHGHCGQRDLGNTLFFTVEAQLIIAALISRYRPVVYGSPSVRPQLGLTLKPRDHIQIMLGSRRVGQRA